MKCFFVIAQILISVFLIGCDISGTVRDLETPVEGVKLTLTGSGIERTAVTDSEGKYRFRSVPSGEYSVTPVKEGIIFYPKTQSVIHTMKNIIKVNFRNFDSAFESISMLTVPGTDFVKTGGELKIMAVGKMVTGKEVIVSEYLTWRSENEDVCAVKDYSQLTKLAVGKGQGIATLVAGTDHHQTQMDISVQDDFYLETDILIPDIPPPSTFPKYTGGCCIETCLWAILNAKGISMTIEEITALGRMHLPGWGLSSYEIVNVLEKLDIDYKYTLSPKIEGYYPFLFGNSYEDILREKVIRKVKEGIPVMFGLKYLPYHIPYIPMDHFILIIGYNEETDEIIYNDINQINRSTVSKLVDGSYGYSAVNYYDVSHIIQFPVDQFL